jgi:hypothetical protein
VGAQLQLYRNEKMISGVCSPSQEIFFSLLMRSVPLRYCTSCNTLQCGIRCYLTDLVKIELPLPRATDLSVPDFASTDSKIVPHISSGSNHRL